eukprot:TRINITY_DN24496_c0_g1_i1.p2 TRINITY_DN24496_c0_g1~~TRINITY_DN24496_c0_g1_i1.p2  ORF type:complete len:108 (+),score=23.12 TRINITY_DN24496_c0_g1_i1:126-449(+)
MNDSEPQIQRKKKDARKRKEREKQKPKFGKESESEESELADDSEEEEEAEALVASDGYMVLTYSHPHSVTNLWLMTMKYWTRRRRARGTTRGSVSYTHLTLPTNREV